jgi:hypothetical protein
MKIIALSVPGPTPDLEKMNELAGEEARNAWELLKADVVREAYLRKDKPGVVVVLEAPSAEAAEAALSQLPFYRHGLIRFELIPGHLPTLNACLHNVRTGRLPKPFW